MASSIPPTKSASSWTPIQAEPPTQEQVVWQSLHHAVRTGSVVDGALQDLYAQIDEAIKQRGPTCWASGRCCNFNTFGHRLYVTGLEISWFLGQVDRTAIEGQNRTQNLSIDPNTTCPFQIHGLCSVHAIRPLGCRIFFCQQGTSDWQRQLYERFLGTLRTLHNRHALPYRYLEWRTGLNQALQYGYE